MHASNRREFLLGSLAAASAVGLCESSAEAIEPIRRQGRSLLRLSLAAYSFRQLLNLQRKPPTMTYDGFIDLAASLPFDAVELTETLSNVAVARVYVLPEPTAKPISTLVAMLIVTGDPS